ncbi:MAG: hypothetical protein V3S66_10615 [Desulfobacterales bacterium]
MAKIINGDVQTYVQQLITETLGFEEGHSRIFENPRNGPPGEGRQDSPESFQNPDNQRSEK